jgi:hypothetical protein
LNVAALGQPEIDLTDNSTALRACDSESLCHEAPGSRDL